MKLLLPSSHSANSSVSGLRPLTVLVLGFLGAAWSLQLAAQVDLREPYESQAQSQGAQVLETGPQTGVQVQNAEGAATGGFSNAANGSTLSRRQVIVEDTVPAAPPAGSASVGANNAELYYQLQALQQELRQLRGLLEEQGFRIDRLSRDQQDQYLDLDRRVAALAQGNGTPGNPAGAVSGSNAGSSIAGANGAGRSSAGAGLASAPRDERGAYSAAFDLMKNKQFDQSIVAFGQVIQEYPNGQFTPNSYYWLGELHLAKADLESSRQSFTQVVNLYPTHNKVPDALYKLGVVYHRLGNATRALEFLDQTMNKYPNTPAAGLARSYAQELR